MIAFFNSSVKQVASQLEFSIVGFSTVVLGLLEKGLFHEGRSMFLILMNILEAKDLTVNVGGKAVLHGVSFSLISGQSHILFGPNGSGKTTLINALVGLPSYEIISGEIMFDGKNITSMSIDERAKLGIAVSFQNPPEIVGVKLVDVLKLCAGKKPKDPFSKEEERLIEAFRLTEFLNRDLNVGFSGGERKRAEILQLILLKPRLLLLDEPDSGVDVESLGLIAKEIQGYLAATAASALIITHKGDILEYIKARYGCILLEGKFHCYTEPLRIYEEIKDVGYEECVACRRRGTEGWKNDKQR
jgi:Fe-S cluster assembly ATP-binding protein